MHGEEKTNDEKKTKEKQRVWVKKMEYQTMLDGGFFVL